MKKGVIANNENLIISWKRQGLTDKNICELLGIGESTLYKYLNEHKEFSDDFKLAKAKLAVDLKDALINMCFKHTLTTTKIINNSKATITETTTKEVDPDISAVNYLLKNIDRNNWKQDWDNYEFKKRELELKEAEGL